MYVLCNIVQGVAEVACGASAEVACVAEVAFPTFDLTIAWMVVIIYLTNILERHCLCCI